VKALDGSGVKAFATVSRENTRRRKNLKRGTWLTTV
jgi:hypothetical protein